MAGITRTRTRTRTRLKNYINTQTRIQTRPRTRPNWFGFRFSPSVSGAFAIPSVDRVLERGPWLIRNSPIILNKWTPTLSLNRNEVNKVPVWIKIYNVPLLAYSEDGLSLIATQVGKPIMLDAFTSSMCVDSWGRISFACALVELSADSELKNQVTMAISNEEGNAFTTEIINIEYEWKPPHCGECKTFGHALIIERTKTDNQDQTPNVRKRGPIIVMQPIYIVR